MKKNILALFIGSLLIMSCTNDENEAQQTSSNDKTLVTKWTQTESNGKTYETTYSYIGLKLDQITYGVDSSFSKYTYTGDLITKIEYFTKTNDLREITTLEYDSSNNLIKENTTDERYEGTYTFISTYTHNNDNTITENYSDSSSSNGDIHAFEKTIYVQDGEVLKTVESSIGYLTNFSYLPKNNPFKNIIGYNKLFFSSYLGEKGNLKIIESKIAEDKNTTYDYTTFTNNNYPLLFVKTYDNVRLGKSSTTIEIEYSL